MKLLISIFLIFITSNLFAQEASNKIETITLNDMAITKIQNPRDICYCGQQVTWGLKAGQKADSLEFMFLNKNLVLLSEQYKKGDLLKINYFEVGLMFREAHTKERYYVTFTTQQRNVGLMIIITNLDFGDPSYIIVPNSCIE